MRNLDRPPEESNTAETSSPAEIPKRASSAQEGSRSELQRVEVSRVGDFDAEYFQTIEGPDGWSALGQENCRNQRYFTVYGSNGERLGIVVVYDTDDDQNISHTVVDPRFRGQGLATRFKEQLMDALKLPFLTLTIATSNTASFHAAEKLPGVVRVSDASYEQEFQKAKFRLERREAQESFSIVERRQLTNVWTRVVLGGRVEVPDSDRQTPEEFRQWLHESLMRETAALMDEWGMVPDADLVARIQAAETPEERAALERAYLERCQELFNQRTSTFRPSSERSTKWDSWPDAMRESGSFNCAGSALLGMRLLEAAGIRQWIGNPVEHVVNLAQLSDGSWWYVDFMNRHIRPIQPSEEEITGVRSFAIREEGLEYRHLIVLDADDAVGVALDNLSTLQHLTHERDDAFSDLDVRAARAYAERFPGILDTVDLQPFTMKLSGRLHAAMETPLMQQEGSRVEAFHALSDDARIREFKDEIGDRTAQGAFLRTVTPEIDRIHRYLAGEDATCNVADGRVHRFAKIMAEVIASKAALGTELHRELVESFIAELRHASPAM